jgi:hypothetical protein
MTSSLNAFQRNLRLQPTLLSGTPALVRASACDLIHSSNIKVEEAVYIKSLILIEIVLFACCSFHGIAVAAGRRLVLFCSKLITVIIFLSVHFLVGCVCIHMLDVHVSFVEQSNNFRKMISISEDDLIGKAFVFFRVLKAMILSVRYFIDLILGQS